jgi:hypothetical protein
MSENTTSNVPSRLELLRMARELVINEYIDKRAQDHNRWLAEADVVWRTRGVKLAYPPFPSYPTEIEIITRATALSEFLNAPSQKEPAPNDLAPVTVPIKPELQQIEPIQEQVKITEAVSIPVPVTTEPVITEVTHVSHAPVTPVIQEAEVNKNNKNEGQLFEKMIPPVLAKIDQFKSTWAIR